MALNKGEYNALTETKKIEANKYLMAKIRRGQKEVIIGEIKKNQLIDPDQKLSKK